MFAGTLLELSAANVSTSRKKKNPLCLPIRRFEVSSISRKLTTFRRTNFIRCIEYTNTFQRDDENDVLTPEEVRETEEMLQAEKDMRKAQGQQATDAARKADGDFRKPNLDASKLAEQAAFAKQAERQIEQERVISESAKLDIALALTVPTIKPPGPQAAPAPRRAIAAPPQTGRNKSVPSAALRAAGRSRIPPPPISAPPINKPSAASTLRVRPNPKYGHPSPSQSVPAPPPPPPPPPPPLTTNGFKLDMSKGLPRVFMPKGKDGAEKSNPDTIDDNSNVGGGKAKGVASVGTLKLKG